MLRNARRADTLPLAGSVALCRAAALGAAIIAMFPMQPTLAAAQTGAGCVSTSQQVTLRGQVRYENVFGPPGFGENPQIDQRRLIPVLALDDPIDICPGTDEEIDTAPIYDVRRVQLIHVRGTGRRWHGRVFVNGELQRGTNAFHYTPVTLIVHGRR